MSDSIPVRDLFEAMVEYIETVIDAESGEFEMQRLADKLGLGCEFQAYVGKEKTW